MSSPQIAHRRPSYLWLWLFLGLVLLTVVGLGLWTQQRTLFQVTQDLQAARLGFTVWRWTLYLVVIGGWFYWINILKQRFDFDEIVAQRLLAARWRLAGWLLLLELVLAQNLVGRFVAHWAG